MKRVGLSLLICFLGVSAGNVVAESSYPISRQIQYSFTLQNKTNRLLEKAEFWAYAPVKQTSTQYCLSLETSHSYRLVVDELNNQILHFTFSNLAPYETKLIAIKAELRFSDTPNPLSSQELHLYLQPEEYIESTAPEISQFANKFNTPKPINTVKNIFTWIADNIKYTDYLKNDRGALYALRNKQGDCTEFMCLFAALCRANNIAARGIGGYVYSGNNTLKPADYHNWAEFYDDGMWKIVDPQKGVFMQNQSDYIAMRVIGKSPKNPMGKSHRFRFSPDGLKVKMDNLRILTILPRN